MANHYGSVVAMYGRDCVGIATDCQHDGDGNLWRVCPRLFCGIGGLHKDIVAVRNRMKIREQRLSALTPEMYTKNLSEFLYDQRKPYQVDCIVAGIQPDGTVEPFISTVDLIGIENQIDDFVAVGDRRTQLHVVCADLWKPMLQAQDLLQIIAAAIVSGSESKVAHVCIVEKRSVTEAVVQLP